MKALLAATLLAISGIAMAGEVEAPATEKQVREIPTSEKEFVEHIKTVDKEQILEQFGEPSIRDDVVTPDGEVVASVWHYRYLNTDDSGAYYKTTELDFVDDKVVMVVFMNHDVIEGLEQPTQSFEEAPHLDL